MINTIQNENKKVTTKIIQNKKKTNWWRNPVHKTMDRKERERQQNKMESEPRDWTSQRHRARYDCNVRGIIN